MQLNAVGWAAVVAPGVLAGAVVGGVLGFTGPGVGAAAIGGAVASWLVVLGADIRRWRRSTISFGVSDLDPARVLVVVDQLRGEGIDVQLVESIAGGLPIVVVKARARDRKRVETALETARSSR